MSQRQMEKDLTTIMNQAVISCGYEELKPEQASIIINKRRSPLLVSVPQPKQVAVLNIVVTRENMSVDVNIRCLSSHVTSAFR